MALQGRVRFALGGLAFGLALGAAALLGGLGPGARADEGKKKESFAEQMKRMNAWNEALGVQCDYCHVPGKFEIETPRKKTARWMQEHMVDALVTKEGTRPIECRTCHEGRARFLPSSQ